MDRHHLLCLAVAAVMSLGAGPQLRRGQARPCPVSWLETLPRGATIIVPRSVRPPGFTRVMDVPGFGVAYRKDRP